MYLELRRMFANFITASNHSVAPRSLRIIGLKSGILGFPGGSDSKDSTCNAEDLGSIPGLGGSPVEGKGYPLQHSGLENSMECVVHGVAKSQTGLSDLLSLSLSRSYLQKLAL